MNLMVMLGMSVCVFCLFYGIPGLWSNIGIYIDPNSFVLVLGGTFGAAIISTSPKDFVSILKIVSGYMYMKQKKIDGGMDLPFWLDFGEKLIRVCSWYSCDGEKEHNSKDRLWNHAEKLGICSEDVYTTWRHRVISSLESEEVDYSL